MSGIEYNDIFPENSNDLLEQATRGYAAGFMSLVP